ncbi:MAG: RhsIA family immunity protein [Prevotellaceae bacterium]|jgi:hypothetical protein|nr:RhsIA family immunity protein [Prevotellaceae bacterium]
MIENFDRECKEALDVLKKFIDAMYKWNSMCQEIDRTPHEFYKQKGMISEKLNEIFIAYLTVKDRKYGRQASLSFSTPPEYNPGTNEILSCKMDGKKVFIEVQETAGFKNRIKYALHFKKDKWLIDKKESFDEFKDKWVRQNL